MTDRITKGKLSRRLLQVAARSLADADAALLVVDVSRDRSGRIGRWRTC